MASKSSTVWSNKRVVFDSSQPCLLLQLPVEILRDIIDCLQDCSPTSVGNLALASSFLRGLALFTQFRSVSLVFYKTDVARQKLDFFVRQNLLSNIRKLVVYTSLFRFYENRQQALNRVSDLVLPALVSAFPQMTGLRSLTWSATGLVIPESLRLDLEARPRRVELKVKVPFVQRDNIPQQQLQDLRDSKMLCSLSVGCICGEVDEATSIMRPLKDVLLSCPNLSRVKFNIHISPDRHSASDPQGYCGLGFVNGQEPLCPWEELELRGYPYGDIGPSYPAQGDDSARYIGYPASVSEAQYWADNFDWSRLRRLLGGSPFMARLAPTLAPQLISLTEIDFPEEFAGLASFLRDLPSSLRIMSVPHIKCAGGVDGILRHGSTLRRLRIYHCSPPEVGFRQYWDERIVEAEQAFPVLGAGLPHLEHLSMDCMVLPRSDDHGEPLKDPREHLKYFVRIFPKLVLLDVNLITDSNPSPLPLTSEDTQPMFEYTHNQADSNQLSSVHTLIVRGELAEYF